MGVSTFDSKERTNHYSSNTAPGRIDYELELLQRHLRILKIIIENEPIGIIRLSNLSQFPQHKVRYSLRILEQEGLIEPSSDGAIIRKKCKEFIRNLEKTLSIMENTTKDLKKIIMI